MALSVRDILQQKINEIQSRVPLQMNGFQDTTSFQDVLANTINPDTTNNTNSTQVSTSNSNLESAKTALATSSAYIPKDKTALMNLIDTAIHNASLKYGIDENLIRAVMKQESGFDPTAISGSGAQGLMQLMPGTARGLGVTDPFDISQNVDGGAQYLRDQLVTFNNDVSLALAAYNAGPNNVKKYDGIPPFEETQNYVNVVLKNYRNYSNGG